MTRNPNLTTKKIRFYRADLGLDARRSQIAISPTDFVPLSGLRFDDGSAYHEDELRVSCGWLDSGDWPIRMRLANIRRADLPQVELRGQLTALVIDPESGLAETAHAAFYPHNIVAIEFNFYGPRSGRFAAFLRDKSPSLTALQLVPLLRHDVVAQLDQLRDIRLFHVRVLPAYIDQVAGEDESLAAALRGLSAMGEVGRAEIILRPQPYSRRPLGQRLRTLIRALANRDDILDGADVLRTAGYNPVAGRIEEIDLLRDEFVAEREVLRAPAPSRGVETSAMYEAIDGAYEGLRTELEGAAGVEIQ